MKRLAASSDVIVENYRPGAMENFGLGWEDIERMNPRAVVLRISGSDAAALTATAPASARSPRRSAAPRTSPATRRHHRCTPATPTVT